MAEAVRRKVGARKKSIKSSAASGALAFGGEWLNEALSVVSWALGTFVLVSFLSFEIGRGAIPGLAASNYDPKHNIMGPVGHFIGTLFAGLFGWASFIPVLWLCWLAIYFWRADDGVLLFSFDKKTMVPRILALVGVSGLLLFSSVLLALFGGSHSGGNLGDALASPLARLFNPLGATIFALAFLVSSSALASRQSVGDVLVSLGLGTRALIKGVFISLPVVTWRSLALGARGIAWTSGKVIGVFGPALFGASRRSRTEITPILPKPKNRKNSTLPTATEEEDIRLIGMDKDEGVPISREVEDAEEPAGSEDVPYEEPEVARAVVQRKTSDAKAEKGFDRIWKKSKGQTKDISAEDPFAAYEPPSLSLLTKGEISPGSEDDAELRDMSRLIELKLKDFGIVGKVTHIHPGPVITLFEYEPAAGVKVGRIAALSDDLAMGLRASSIRIIAPIPKRGTVGIEVPNRHRDIVRLRDVLESDAFVNGESILSVAMGKDTYGDPVVVDIASMPHLLMAGATGTGKSVCINALILSLLYRARPSELGLILIDPKILELSVYDDIPHLRVPVVTVPRQAKAVLDWATNEMNRRYRVMQKFGVRNIDSYNKIVSGEGENAKPKEKKRLEDDVVMLKEEEIIEPGIVEPSGSVGEIAPDAESEGESEEPQFADKLKPLPKIVIIIDELADLMLSVGRDIEELITRLAQKARAAGIHLIVATQRPSVDVITGLIKANFPARLSFRVSSRIDSRTILDSMGADKLLGRGDMLFMVPGGEGLRRIHGAFVSDTEVKQAVAAIKSKCKPHYDERIMAICEKALEEENSAGAAAGGTAPEDYDEMYDKCVEFVLERGQASTSMLQRAFRLGYNRAARIVDMMEREGLVGPMDGAKPREVLVQTGNQIDAGGPNATGKGS